MQHVGERLRPRTKPAAGEFARGANVDVADVGGNSTSWAGEGESVFPDIKGVETRCIFSRADP